ncbi:MAG TPA: M14 family metallopeptidase [Chitinophagaceae bacterium]|nr:M14 family metallopeptidase [Chitinophagaceae bacterium]
MKRFLFIAAFFVSLQAAGQQTEFEKSNGIRTATYFQAISFYKNLAKSSKKIVVKEKGPTDAGYPLHLVMISNDGKFDPGVWHRQNKVVILINNGIHPGEPDGIDASMMLARDILNKKVPLPDNIALAIIPVYNIGGALNRNSFSRANQNGPESYGFRGNAQNLDLNRDFIKSDSKNARSFAAIFHYVNPDILIDNHVSDGADYRHVMTLITTQYEKLGGELGEWLKNTFEPALYKGMHDKGWDMVPYVNVEDSDPSKGFTQFYDSPRYSSGYAALFSTISFMPETHMLKPYKQRVLSDYDLMITMIQQAGIYEKELLAKRRNTINKVISQTGFPLSWKPDTSKYDEITFEGYEAGKRISDATGLPVLFYDHNKPFTKKVRFYDVYAPGDTVQKPGAYIIPQGWWTVLDLLRLNHVRMTRLNADTVIEVTWYHIDEYKSSPRAYEKHHMNYNVKVSKSTGKMKFLKGDYLIRMDQPANRYLAETLEPTGEDGFFAWNFFDAVLQEKEYYSDYRWDSLAARILKKDATLRQNFLQKKSADSSFAKNPEAQYDYIYKHSPWYEPEHLKYPVYRIEK